MTRISYQIRDLEANLWEVSSHTRARVPDRGKSRRGLEHFRNDSPTSSGLLQDLIDGLLKFCIQVEHMVEFQVSSASQRSRTFRFPSSATGKFVSCRCSRIVGSGCPHDRRIIEPQHIAEPPLRPEIRSSSITDPSSHGCIELFAPFGHISHLRISFPPDTNCLSPAVSTAQRRCP
jgi:hypothetical protein